MQEYHKIETPHKRDIEGTKKLIETEFRSPSVEFLKDCKWIGKEKIDGTNICIYWDGHKVQIGGRTDRAELHGDLVSHLKSKFQTNEAEELFEQMFGEKEVYLFGEGYGNGIQSGGYYRKDKAFVLFDVKINESYTGMETITEVAQAFNVPVVPVVVEGTIDEIVAYIKTKPNSVLAEEPHEMEGVVAVPAIPLRTNGGARIVVKIKCCDYE